MLVISRRPDEAVVIDTAGGIVVKVLGVQGHKVTLGFEAARNVRVDREEVVECRNKSESKVPTIATGP